MFILWYCFYIYWFVALFVYFFIFVTKHPAVLNALTSRSETVLKMFLLSSWCSSRTRPPLLRASPQVQVRNTQHAVLCRFFLSFRTFSFTFSSLLLIRTKKTKQQQLFVPTSQAISDPRRCRCCGRNSDRLFLTTGRRRAGTGKRPLESSRPGTGCLRLLPERIGEVLYSEAVRPFFL